MAHSHHAAHQHHKRQPNPPPRRHPRQDHPKGRRGTTQPKPATSGRGQQPCGRRDTGNTHTHTTRKGKTKTANNAARKRRDGGSETTRTQDQDNQRPTPQSQKNTKGEGGGHTPPTATPAHPRATGGPPRRVGASGAHARPNAHPNNTKGRRGAAKTQTPTHRPTPHTRTGNDGEQKERAHSHARPKTLPRKGGMQLYRPKPKPNRKHREPQRGKEGQNHKPYPNTPTQDPSQGWQGYRNPRPRPSTTRTEAQTPHNTRKPSVHSPGTEAARAMQVTRPNEIRSPGVRLHPKACAAMGLEAERATPRSLGTPVPRTCMHALGTEKTRKFGEPLGFRQKQGTCASTGAHPSGETSTSRWRRSALPVWPWAALLAATSQV